jgi:hypothetical protein
MATITCGTALDASYTATQVVKKIIISDKSLATDMNLQPPTVVTKVVSPPPNNLLSYTETTVVTPYSAPTVRKVIIS